MSIGQDIKGGFHGDPCVQELGDRTADLRLVRDLGKLRRAGTGNLRPLLTIDVCEPASLSGCSELSRGVRTGAAGSHGSWHLRAVTTRPCDRGHALMARQALYQESDMYIGGILGSILVMCSILWLVRRD
jgi:hypothetical protein